MKKLLFILILIAFFGCEMPKRVQERKEFTKEDLAFGNHYFGMNKEEATEALNSLPKIKGLQLYSKPQFDHNGEAYLFEVSTMERKNVEYFNGAIKSNLDSINSYLISLYGPPNQKFDYPLPEQIIDGELYPVYVWITKDKRIIKSGIEYGIKPEFEAGFSIVDAARHDSYTHELKRIENINNPVIPGTKQ